ncbi:TadE/TadG family type IV pilus assembly protein [Desulfonatronum lacustre]|uniref:TadE/TadG family type IV pilus assembly protein n=1 Tax=Desulfonatronum lacustre TaxID=66849 RepID=UPI00048BF1CF|nr:TadE/TadG family type IV pilus assembly protein [Desulfonatronum lacustre]
MKGRNFLQACRRSRHRTPRNGEQGVALIEFALILPLLALLAFVVIDFGRLFHARLIVTNVSREGGSIASRGFKSGDQLLNMLQASAEPLDLHGEGRILITRVRAGTGIPEDLRVPRIASVSSRGSLNASSSIHENRLNMGFTETIYTYLLFNETHNTSIISEVVVVEVFFHFRPVTPLPNFLRENLFPDDGGMIIGSRSVLQFVQI